MPIIMEANYSKKLGLPGYSSHQYSLTLRCELADVSQVASESARLHGLLQASVDRDIQKTGFLPGTDNGNHRTSNGNGKKDQPWECSPNQKSYILDLIEKHQLDKNDVEKLAQELFGKSVPKLNKLEASGLIEELKEKHEPRGRGRSAQPARR